MAAILLLDKTQTMAPFFLYFSLEMTEISPNDVSLSFNFRVEKVGQN